MSASQVNDLINPARLRLGIKRAFTGVINEILSELLQNSARAGARNVRITADDRGVIYQDDGRGLRDRSDFESLLKLGESGWGQRIEEDQRPNGLGIHSLLAHDEVESVTVPISNNWQRLPIIAWMRSYHY